MAVDIISEEVEKINNRISPIQDEYIEKYLSEKELKLTATLDAQAAYTNADFVVIAAPTNYDSQKNFFDTSAVEAVIELVLLPNYAMNERFSTTKKLYHERKQFVKRLLKMQQIVAFLNIQSKIPYGNPNPYGIFMKKHTI